MLDLGALGKRLEISSSSAWVSYRGGDSSIISMVDKFLDHRMLLDLLDGLRLDLADTLAGNVEFLAHLLEAYGSRRPPGQKRISGIFCSRGLRSLMMTPT